MAMISINYDEGNTENLGYKSVEVSYGARENETKLFDCGDFVKDWFDCLKWVITSKLIEGEYLVHSSSVNHFIMDGAPYDSAYLTYNDNLRKHELRYSGENWKHGIEFFVPKGTIPTWGELKEICK